MKFEEQRAKNEVGGGGRPARSVVWASVPVWGMGILARALCGTGAFAGVLAD